MELSRSLLKKFADITNDLNGRSTPVLSVYGTAVVHEEKKDPEAVSEEGRDDSDISAPTVKKTKYVRIDGSDILTPVSEATDMRDGDRVLVTIQDHTATVIGNVTCPSSARTATDLDPLLEEQSARIDTLIAGKITTEYLEANYATIAHLQAQNAVIGSLKAGVADINTLMFGSASGNVIQTQFSNSVIAQLGDAQIKSAMIEEIAADKITGLDINTTKFTVHSDDGNSKWQDNTIQISDGTKLRIQIGKDASSDYNIYIWDKNGKLMFDALGLTGDGIQRAIIRNDMVREDANISAGKLDIGSLFTVMNNDGTHTLRSNKIYVDADGQTLDISFKQMTTAVNGINDAQISQGTQLSVIQGQIASKIWEQDITDAVGGVNGDIAVLSTKYSTLEQNLNGFKVEVGNTYATASGLMAVDTRYTQLADRFNWVVKNGTSSSDFTITDRMAELTAAYINLNGLVTFSGLSPNIQTDISSATSSASNALNIANNLNKRADSGEFKGEKGDTGNGIKSSAVTYQSSTSGTSVPTGAWSASIPSVAANNYLWTRTVLTYTNGSTSTSYSVGKMGATGSTGATGATGSTGATGKGIKSVVEQYYLSTSNTSQAGGSWKNTQDAWASGRYVWIRQFITWTDNSTTYTTPVLASAINSANQNASTASTNASSALSTLANWCYNNDKTIINGGKIATGTITAAKIASGTITADKLNVSSLSAISANIGTITAGTFGGFIIDGNNIRSKPEYSNSDVITIRPKSIIIETNTGTTITRMDVDGLYGNTVTCLKIVNKNNTVGQTINLDGSDKSFEFKGGYSIKLETDVTAEIGVKIKNPTTSNYLGFIISAVGNKGIYDSSDSIWMIRKGTDNIIYIPQVYTKTTTGSANVNVYSNGALRRYASSSQRYKHDIRYFSNVDNAVSSMSKRGTRDIRDSELLSILRLPVCSFLYDRGYINGDVGYDPDRPIYGFIAEDVEHVCPDAVEYYVEPSKHDSMDREIAPEECTTIPESWDMKKLFPKAVYVIQKHEDDIKSYKAALILLYSAVDKAGLLEPGIKDHISQMIA